MSSNIKNPNQRLVYLLNWLTYFVVSSGVMKCIHIEHGIKKDVPMKVGRVGKKLAHSAHSTLNVISLVGDL